MRLLAQRDLPTYSNTILLLLNLVHCKLFFFVGMVYASILNFPLAAFSHLPNPLPENMSCQIQRKD